MVPPTFKNKKTEIVASVVFAQTFDEVRVATIEPLYLLKKSPLYVVERLMG